MHWLLGLAFLATNVIGPGNFGKVTVDAINATGLIKLNGTIVSNDIRLVGCIIAHNGDIGSLDVIGDVNLTETTIKEGGQVIGSIQAVRSTIKKPMTLWGQKAVFTATKLQGLTIKQEKSYKGKQIIELRQGTIVDGPIHFESGKGEVLLYPGSQLLGSVTGGKVLKKS